VQRTTSPTHLEPYQTATCSISKPTTIELAMRLISDLGVHCSERKEDRHGHGRSVEDYHLYSRDKRSGETSRKVAYGGAPWKVTLRT
jgi:hypothetical protein